MKKILVGLLLAALNNKQVQDAAGDFVARLVTQKLMPLLPVLAAAAAKAVTDQIPELANVADVAEVTEQVRQRLHEAIPDVDFGIPELDNVLDFWRPK